MLYLVFRDLYTEIAECCFTYTTSTKIHYYEAFSWVTEEKYQQNAMREPR